MRALRHVVSMVLLCVLALAARAQFGGLDCAQTPENPACAAVFDFVPSDADVIGVSPNPVFRNPMLIMRVDTLAMRQSGVQQVYMPLSVLAPEADEHCELILTGFVDDAGGLQRTLDVAQVREELRIAAFCRNLNLIGDDGLPVTLGRPFPTNTTRISATRRQLLPPAEAERLQPLLSRLQSSACPNPIPNPNQQTVGVSSVTAQLAVFVLFRTNVEDTWTRFKLGGLDDPALLASLSDAIFGCLLADVAGISTPVPSPTVSPTFTPSHTPTNTPTLTPTGTSSITPSPTFTHTPLPLSVAVERGLTESGVQSPIGASPLAVVVNLLLIAGTVLLALSLLAARRWLLLLGFVVGLRLLLLVAAPDFQPELDLLTRFADTITGNTTTVVDNTPTPAPTFTLVTPEANP